MEKNKRLKKGFSLIELIMVILLTVVFSALSLPYFNSSTEDKKLDQEAKYIVDFLELAKQKAAASSVTEIDVASCTTFRGYRVVFDSSTAYRLRACCSSVAQPNAECAYSKDLQLYTVPSNISMTYTSNISSPTNYIFFPVLDLGTNLLSQATITVRNSVNSKCIPIRINQVGVINEDPKVAC